MDGNGRKLQDVVGIKYYYNCDINLIFTDFAGLDLNLLHLLTQKIKD